MQRARALLRAVILCTASNELTVRRFQVVTPRYRTNPNSVVLAGRPSSSRLGQRVLVKGNNILPPMRISNFQENASIFERKAYRAWANIAYVRLDRERMHASPLRLVLLELWQLRQYLGAPQTNWYASERLRDVSALRLYVLNVTLFVCLRILHSVVSETRTSWARGVRFTCTF